MWKKVVKLKEVRRDIEKIKSKIGKKEIVIFGSLAKNFAIKKESDIDIAIKGKLTDTIRNFIYSEFAEKFYRKYGLILLLHEIREKEWESFLEKIGEYKKI